MNETCEHGRPPGQYCPHCAQVVPKRPKRSETHDIVDGEDEEAFKARASGIPMDFAGQQRSMIHLPTLDEQKLFSRTRVRTCGSCKHFSRHHFAPHQAKFLAELHHEYEWDKKCLAEDPDKMGRCGNNPELVTGPNSLACSNYRERQ